MRVIFLDIDGVVTSARTGWFNMDIYTVTFLRWLCEKANARIVISSTWRKNHGQEFWEPIFGNRLHDDWATPILDEQRASGIWMGYTRGTEIQAWLDAHPTVEKYLILDDDGDMLEHQRPSFIQTDSLDGMLFEHMIAAREYWAVETFHKGLPLFQHPNMFDGGE